MLLKQDLWEILVCQCQCSYNYNLYNSAIWENSWLAVMKNTINISNNVNVVLNTYGCLFFFKLLLRTFDVVRQLQPCHARRVSTLQSVRQDSVEMERFWNLQLSKFVNHNGNKMVDVCIWNVNKLTEARTKMGVGKLRTSAAQWLSQCHQTRWGWM